MLSNLFRRNRVTTQEKEALAEDSEEASKRQQEELEERRRQSHAMVAESIRKELAESKSVDCFFLLNIGSL